MKVDRPDPLLGSVIDDRYRVVRRIGEGGMGIVYEVEHVVIEKRLALKVLREDYSSRPEVVARFRQEAKSASRIGNEHIVDISDFGETSTGASYFVMELLDGEDLANVLSREGTLPLSRAADIITQCARALAAAHAKGIVHRDMKPENIFLTRRDGRPDFVKIVDFGIAKMSDIETAGQPGRKLTKTGMIFGTPEYMSPEQAAGKALDHRVDIYALAVIFFELLTGRVPFSGDTFMGVLTQHMFEVPPSLAQANPALQVPESVESFVRKGLAKDPGERYQTCDELIAALEKAVRGVSPSSAPPPGKPTQIGFGEPSRSLVPPVSAAAPAQAEAPVERPSHGLLFVGLGLVGIALAGGAYYAMSGGGGPADDLATSEPTTRAELPDAATAPAFDAFVEPDAFVSSDAGPEMISVGVVTTPPGARVELMGSQGIGCEATPCNLMLPLGEHVRLQAHVRNRSAIVEVDVVRDMAPVTIAIRPRGGGAGGGEDPGGTTSIGPLKIPTVLEGPRGR
ncbi:MAG: hypothetical protein OHK0013_04350 [Sandaracinaceae bacterium]